MMKKPVHFLLVDDLQENLIALEALLKRDGLVLLKARSGAEALELLLKHDIALALLDVQMPEMNGFELAELMRGTERTKAVPIIFLTAANEDQQRRFRGYEAGAVDFLHKPIETDILLSKVNVFYELYRQRQEVTQQRDELSIITKENERLLEESNRYAQALKEADQRKDEFLANMSHEIRTPMNAILGLSSVLMKQDMNEKQIKLLKTLHESAESLLLLINDLLDISKVQSGSIVLENIPFNLSNVAEAIHAMVGMTAHNRGLTFTVHDDAVKDYYFRGDPSRMKQVLLNLCSNAIKFTHEGSVELTMGCNPPQDSDGRMDVTIEVRDTGIGIHPDKIQDVFDKFMQADSSISREYGGTGLGLSICKSLIEAMGGTITLTSELGKGSVFSIVVPLEVAEDVMSATKDETSHEPQSSPQLPRDAGKKVLLVEDHPPNVLVATLLLDGFGYAYDVVGNGQEAIEKRFEEDYFVILMDVQMPGMNGFEATGAIREREKIEGVDACYIVGMTAHAMTGDRERCMDAGMDDYLSKPFDLAEFEELLNKRAMAA